MDLSTAPAAEPAARPVNYAFALGALAVAAACVLSFRGVYEPDLWWHLAQGRYDAGGHLVRSNVFSFIYPDYRQTYTSWAGELGIYLLWKWFGMGAIQAAQAAALLLTFVLTWKACRLRGSALASLAVMIVGFFVVEPRAIPRPHLASFAGLAACALLIERCGRARSAAPLVWACAVIAVWSNFHVECLFGVALVGAFAVGEFIRPSVLTRAEARRALMVAAAAGLAACLNPYGIGIVRYLAENALVPQILRIAELLPPYLPNYRAFFVYLAVGAVLLLWQFRTLALWELFAFAGLSVLALQHLRFTTLLFVGTAAIVTGRVNALIETGIDGRALVATALAAALAISRVPVAAMPRQIAIGEHALTPTEIFSPGASAFARAAGLRGPVFNSQNLGGYLAWTLYPDTTIFQDGRLQAYPPEHIRAILDARDQAQWDALVSGVDWAVLSLPRANELSGVGRFQAVEWATVYWDDAVQVVARRHGAFAGVVSTQEYTRLLPGVDPFLLAAQADAAERAPVVAETRRNRRDNPKGFAAMAVLCLEGDAQGCIDAERLSFERQEYGPAVARLNQARPRAPTDVTSPEAAPSAAPTTRP